MCSSSIRKLTDDCFSSNSPNTDMPNEPNICRKRRLSRNYPIRPLSPTRYANTTNCVYLYIYTVTGKRHGRLHHRVRVTPVFELPAIVNLLVVRSLAVYSEPFLRAVSIFTPLNIYRSPSFRGTRTPIKLRARCCWYKSLCPGALTFSRETGRSSATADAEVVGT